MPGYTVMKLFPTALALAWLALAHGPARAQDARCIHGSAGAVHAVESIPLRGTCTVLDTTLSATYRGDAHWIAVLEMEDADRERELAGRLAWVRRAPGFAGGRRIELPIAVELGALDAAPGAARRVHALGAGEVFGMDAVPVRMAVVCGLSSTPPGR